jgi:hypothetical protein
MTDAPTELFSVEEKIIYMIYFRGVDAFESCLSFKRLIKFNQLFLG